MFASLKAKVCLNCLFILNVIVSNHIIHSANDVAIRIHYSEIGTLIYIVHRKILEKEQMYVFSKDVVMLLYLIVMVRTGTVIIMIRILAYGHPSIESIGI